MTISVYILHSHTCDRYYCGQSSNVEQRVRQHHDPEYQLSKTTKRFSGPWRLVWQQKCTEMLQQSIISDRLQNGRWKLQDLADVYNRKYGTSHHKRTIRREIKRAGYSWGPR